MGQKSRSDSVVRIFSAFITQKSWRQPELARNVRVSVHRLRAILDEHTAHMPLVRDEESSTDVYWSVDKNWFPGGAYFANEDLNLLLNQLARMPRGRNRKRLMDAVARSLTGSRNDSERLDDVVVAPAAEDEERFIDVLLDAAKRRVAVRCRYHSRSSGHEGWRHISIQRVDSRTPSRVVAVKHEDGKLAIFRVDAFRDAELDQDEKFREVDEPKLNTFLE